MYDEPLQCQTTANWDQSCLRATYSCLLDEYLGPLYFHEHIPSVEAKPEKACWWQGEVCSITKTWNWKHVIASDALDPAHIHMKELRASRLYVRRRAHNCFGSKPGSMRGERVLLLSDSRAVVGMLNHGRSPSDLFNMR